MSVIDTLITDRTQAHVDRLKQLMKIGWQNMTDDEKAEYIGGGADQLTDMNGVPLFDSQNEPLYSADPGSVQKGAYNYTDLNRVEEAVAYVAAELVQADTDLRAYAAALNVDWDPVFAVPYDPDDYHLTTKTDWVEDVYVPPAEMTRYIGNIKLIQAAIPDAPTTWIPDSMDGLTFESANNIEQLLKDVDAALDVVVATREGYIRSALAVRYSGEIYSGEGEA